MGCWAREHCKYEQSGGSSDAPSGKQGALWADTALVGGEARGADLSPHHPQLGLLGGGPPRPANLSIL